MAEITVSTPSGPQARLTLSKERIRIGRSRECDVFLPDQWLSRHHAEIRRLGEGFVVVDLGSKNGTLVNGKPIAADTPLRHGDVITLGEHSLSFVAGTANEEEEDEGAPEGTRIFSAREIGDITGRRTTDAVELARQNRLLVALNKATSELVVHRPLDQLFEKILDLLFEAVPAERAAILVLEGDPGTLAIRAQRCNSGQPLTRVSRSIAGLVLKGQTLLLPNVLQDARFRSEESILSSGIRSAVCVPLWLAGTTASDAVLGMVYLDSRAATHSFGEDDLRLLTSLANVAAAKIENVRLLEESLQRQLLEEDMRVAAEIQRGLLPAAPPQIEGWELVGTNIPCRSVGGDYYDFALEGDRLLIALGDVSGKGSGAALLMTMLRAAVRGLWTVRPLAEAVERINRTVCQNTPANKFVTFVLAELDPASGELSYVNAGHNPPLLVRADGSISELGDGGMVLGLLERTPYSEGRVLIEAGDTLAVFSDGVTETWSPQDVEFGEAGLREVLERHHGLRAAQLQATILQTLVSFSAGAHPTDDRTLVVLKRI